MKLYLIGTGTEGCRTLTKEAADAINASDMLIGASRMLKPYIQSSKTCITEYKPDAILRILSESVCEIVSVLFSGDTGFFSGARNLIAALPQADITVIPGISSAAAFCAKIGKNYENMRFLSLHGTSSNIAIQAAMHPLCFFLLGGSFHAADVCKRLCEYHLPQVRVYIGQNLGYPDEQIVSGAAADFTEYPDDTLSVLVTENPDYLRYIPSAIPDSEFLRTNIPMTKSQIRCNIVSALRIRHDGVCWDIGCGTGSVSVEMAYRCPDGTVLAFDRNAEAVRLTAENAKRFSCDNIIASEGICPDVLKQAAAPDHVFIGGSSGCLSGIFAVIAEKDPAADIVISAVSLETLSHASDCFRLYGADCEIMQLAVTNTRKIGTHTMLDAQNPVFLIRGRLQCGAS